MLFNSETFFIFLSIVFLLYWLLQGRALWIQNLLLLIASYVFYGWWDWRFLFLIVFTSLLDFWLGLKIGDAKSSRAKKLFLLCSLVSNLSILGVFKYFNFFVGSFCSLAGNFGFNCSGFSLNVILPVGISFYTFQSMGYTIDVYRGNIAPTRSPLTFLTFVSFFPQLVAGPIERASNMLGQFTHKRSFGLETAKEGLRRILWGLFKKIVIADNLALAVEYIFRNFAVLNGATLAQGAFFFAIQIYCDFSAYSEIATGSAQLFGFRLMRNFACPYFSENIVEFWHRWHISLSTWFRDYVYISLGGNRVGKVRKSLNILCTFLASGLWHGANWTFVAWGFLHGVYYVIANIKAEAPRVARSVIYATIRRAGSVMVTFSVVALGWIFFRSQSVETAASYIARMFSHPMDGISRFYVPFVTASILLLGAEFIQRSKEYTLDIKDFHPAVRWTAYYFLIGVILIKGNLGHVPFIYFQF
jgi:alginate O-acetyltransferase complex protein AlgI